MIALFGPDGLLRRSKATVVLATSNDSFLHLADTTINLGADVAKSQIHTVNTAVKDDSNGVSEKSSITYVQKDISYVEKASIDEPLNLRAAGLRSVSKQQNSDFTVYAYYARVVGRTNLCLFLALVICFVFGLSFPRKLLSPSCLTSLGKMVNFRQRSGFLGGRNRMKLAKKTSCGCTLVSTLLWAPLRSPR